MKFGIIVFVASLVPTLAEAQAKEVGNLVLEGIPEIPSRIVKRNQQYNNLRGASLVDWDPRGEGMLISTRFGETAQLHHVARPEAYRQQLTFFAEPVLGAAYDGKRTDGFWLMMDAGGGEFYQFYWFDRKTGTAELVTDGKSRNESLLPARSGGRIAFVSTRRNRTDFDIYVQDGASLERARLVKEVSGQWAVLDWSPDETKLLVTHEVSANEGYLYVLDIDSGELKEINPQPAGKKIAYWDATFARKGAGIYYTSDEDSEFLRLTYYDLASGKKAGLTAGLDWNVEHVAVSDDGNWLAYVANEGGTSVVYLAKTSRPTKAKKVALPIGVVSKPIFDGQSRRLGISIATAQTNADVYSVELGTGKLTRWTFSEIGGLDAKRLNQAASRRVVLSPRLGS